MDNTFTPHERDPFDPATTTARDATHFRRMVAAAKALAAAEAELTAAVAAARKAGDSWTVVGVALGTTRQAAQQRFGTTRLAKKRHSKKDQAPTYPVKSQNRRTSYVKA